MSILDTFFILFKADTKPLDEGLQESEKKAGSLVDKLKDLDKTGTVAGQGIYKLLGQAAGFLGLGLSVGALVHGIKDMAAEYDDLGKLATRFRDSADALDGFLDSLELLGVSKETGIDTLKSFDTAIQDTALGLGRAKKVFDDLGISVRDAAGKIKPTTVVLGELQARMAGFDQATKIRIMERLGLDPALLKLFNADLADLQSRMANIDRATGFDFEAALKRSQEYTKAQKAMKLEVNTLTMYFGKLIEKFQTAALPWLTDSVKRTTEVLKTLVDFLMRHTKFVEGFFIAAAGAILYFLVPAAIKGAIAVWAMIAPFALAAAAVIAVGAAFALLYEDVMTFYEGGDSLIGQILERWPIISDVVGNIVDAFKALWDIGEQVYEQFVQIWNDPQAAFEKFLNFVLEGIGKIIRSIPGVSTALDAWNAITGPRGGAAATLPPETTAGAVALGQARIAQAATSPISSVSSSAISNSRMSNKSTDVKIDKIEVKTQATDASGIAKSIGDSMTSQMRQAAANYDDGILA